MRYGIFSDIHSNLEALESVLRGYSRENIDCFFCVGDIVGYGADPVACLERVKELPALTLAGNHDWAVAGRISVLSFNPYAAKAVRWNRQALDASGLKFLEALRLVYNRDCCTFVHGTLDEPAVFKYLLDPSNAADTFSLMETQVCFVGHTHVAGIFAQGADGKISYSTSGMLSLEKGYRYIVNVGSVGQPRDGDPRSSYCVFDREAGTIEIKRLAYDVEASRRKIIDGGLPEFLGDRLLYGQ